MKVKNPIQKFFTNIYVKNILLMIGIFLAFVAVMLLFMNIYTKHNESVVVPSVKGLQVEEASRLLSSNNLQYTVIDSIFQSDGVPGAILEQIPIEESKVKTGRTVYLKIKAKSTQMVSIPELRDYSRRQAEAQLNSLGFNKIIIEEIPSPYADIVISVSYKGKTVIPTQSIPKGATLRMVVGAGGLSTSDSDSTKTDTDTDAISDESQ